MCEECLRIADMTQATANQVGAKDSTQSAFYWDVWSFSQIYISQKINSA
jgi:hypothetical protein